jgi:hypothetical protein
MISVLLLALLPQSTAFCTTRSTPPLYLPNSRITSQRYLQEDPSSDDTTTSTSTRRNILRVLAAGAFLAPASPSWAGEVGAIITKAVTTSDLGLSVRTSVVKGAQVIDKVDGQWERLSDRFGLGSERSKQGQRPKPKVIPDPLPLDVTTAQKILDSTDQVFASVTGIRPAVLQERIEKVADQVKLAFERSGLILTAGNPLRFETGPQFNFVVYSHYKAYSELIVEGQIPFKPFLSKFEKQVGEILVDSLQPGYSPTTKSIDSSKSPEDKKEESMQMALNAVDKLCTVLRDKGLVAAVERSAMDEDKLYDWCDGTSDFEYTVALDGDITLNAQILLQEQGFRLYPDFARYAITYLMQKQIPDQKVSAMDYYFDTDYSSDPDKFEVKEVLLSITVES